MQMKSWGTTTLQYYYEGIHFGNYPSLIIEQLAAELRHCHSLLDICSGPGAFSLYALSHGWRTLAIDLSATALQALQREAQAYPEVDFQAICGDFLAIEAPHADIAVAACCFFEQMGQPAALAKILDCAGQIALFVQRDDCRQAEFLTDGLPIDPAEQPNKWQNNDLPQMLSRLAKERGLLLHSARADCDFGCLYAENDADLVDFISRKTGVSDLPVLQRHLAKIAVNKNGRRWLPNPKTFTFFWLNKNERRV